MARPNRAFAGSEAEDQEAESADRRSGGRDLPVPGCFDHCSTAKSQLVSGGYGGWHRFRRRIHGQLCVVGSARGLEANRANHAGLCGAFAQEGHRESAHPPLCVLFFARHDCPVGSFYSVEREEFPSARRGDSCRYRSGVVLPEVLWPSQAAGDRRNEKGDRRPEGISNSDTLNCGKAGLKIMHILSFIIDVILAGYVVWEVVQFVPRYRQLKQAVANGDAGARPRIYQRALWFEWISALLALVALGFDWSKLNPKFLALEGSSLMQSLPRGSDFDRGSLAGVGIGLAAGMAAMVIARIRANRRGMASPRVLD